ncbi:hypothetical protein [Sporocytophaga myxococcoides]|uniref:hypothetical protein n=1 Tax=Sporocytophaga myxococcoides TaxID=153721 RepID=UPI0004002A04|nr:hypothetical protein [Sporocytophaga myxococcoides]
MIVVKVTYAVKPEFADKNRENIALFLEDFSQLNGEDFRYNVYESEDRKTFMHLSHYRNEAIQKELLNVPSFKSFQKQRDESGLEMEPKIEVMNLVGAAHLLFN